MNLKSQMQDDVDKVFLNPDDHADSGCVYTYYSTSAVVSDVNAAFSYNDSDSLFEAEGEWKQRSADVLISKSKIPIVSRGDTITNQDGDLFTIEKINSESPASYEVFAKEKIRKSLGALQRK